MGRCASYGRAFALGAVAAWSSAAQQLGGSPTPEDRIRAAPALWEWARADFNALMRLAPADVKLLQHRLAKVQDHSQRRALSILLSLNCALPADAVMWRQLQAYRCGRMAYQAFNDWALSPQGDVYALAFAKSPDQATAVQSLMVLLAQENTKAVDQVDRKELLSELIGYLKGGGLP